MTTTRGELVAQASFANNHQLIFKDPKISMLDKFDRTKAKFHGYLQQVELFLCVDPLSYVDRR